MRARPAMSAGVPVACPMARYEGVCSGHSRIRQIASELQIVWSGKHDKPVPKLVVRGPAPGFVTDTVRFALRLAGMNSMLIRVPCEHAPRFGIGWGIRAGDHAVRRDRHNDRRGAE